MSHTPTAPVAAPLGDFPWGQVQQVEYQAANSGPIVQACHAMLYARTEARFVRELPCRAWVMMQMRFDGKLGFPGGIVSDLAVPDASLEDGLNRELQEEIRLDVARFGFTRQHYVISHFCPRVNLILNLYAQEVTEAEFREIERQALTADEYGHECLGVLRIPLYTMHDGLNGFPAFLQNQFAGTSVLQVMVGLVTQDIVTEEEAHAYMNVLPRHHGYRKLFGDALVSYRQRRLPAEPPLS
ncbi:U8 snoRNA-decapping enzyme-like isoform X2 [Paramacrobiotus metropolitanus]|nr:U8 snoRNA-decapping enzyme-like isoform X2 [Paramacrobiotus metropolitanus]XP_055339630.1 U8 snoRNA-decapping enzyme-like isoform X2 [Paramacrobiotus metropolitanus]XP_055339631.1 U8 snoRNA-decapping enzyme-like isoform X2 [Paramacrobiotus metropolitanus]XP_055339632.1 U8 snoRNA-decapping enzyme-like isoform X2 [Paramacrobiotus metropolitanus]